MSPDSGDAGPGRGVRGWMDALLGSRPAAPEPAAAPAAATATASEDAGAPSRLDAALEAFGGAMVELDRELRIVWASREWSGQDARQLVGRSVLDLWPLAQAQRVQQACKQVLHTGAPQRIDLALEGGEAARATEHHVTPLRDASGLATGLRIVMAEARRDARAARRQEQDLLFRVAQDQSLDAFEVLRPLVVQGRTVDFVWEYANPAAAALLGRSIEQMIGQRLLADPRDKLQVDRFEHWVQVLSRGQPMRAVFEQRAAQREGAALRVLETLSLSLGDRLAATTRDVSAERRQLDSERSARESLLRSTRMRDRFLANLSHELRTPLNAIVGWAHVLGSPHADASQMPKAAEAIARNARSQAVLVDDLVDMNRIVSGTLTLARQRCDLSATLLQAVLSVDAQARARWLRIDTSGIVPGVFVHGDPMRLQQIFWHVLTNAVKFTPLNGAIDIRLDASGDKACVVIADSGEGIPPEQLPHLFDGGSSDEEAPAVRRPAGLGLGLAIVRSLVQLHGGEVRVHSGGVGRGTTVQIDLPLADTPASAEPPAPAVPAAPAERDHAPGGARLAWRRILIVDDDADSLELMSMLLRNEGAIVRAFDRAEDALAAAENGTFDLIVSDLGMPGMDGLELMRRISQRPLPIKAIALTAYTGDVERNQAIAAGFSRVETKPISPPHFLQVVLSEVGRALG